MAILGIFFHEMLGGKAVNIKLHAMPGGEGGGGLKTISCGSRKVFHMGWRGSRDILYFPFFDNLNIYQHI